MALVLKPDLWVWNHQKRFRLNRIRNRNLESGPGPVWFRPGTTPFATLISIVFHLLKWWNHEISHFKIKSRKPTNLKIALCISKTVYPWEWYLWGSCCFFNSLPLAGNCRYGCLCILHGQKWELQEFFQWWLGSNIVQASYTLLLLYRYVLCSLYFFVELCTLIKGGVIRSLCQSPIGISNCDGFHLLFMGEILTRKFWRIPLKFWISINKKKWYIKLELIMILKQSHYIARCQITAYK